MRIAIVSAPSKRRRPPDFVTALAKGMELMGHYVVLVDAWADDGARLGGCEYIAIVAEPVSFFSGKIPDVVGKILASGSGIGGKKSAAFVKKSGLRTGKALSLLMKAMEKEGMLINWSDVLLSAPHAEAMGKTIGTYKIREPA